MFKRTYDHVLREVSKLSGGIETLFEKDPIKKEWQEVKALVEAEAVEAKAQEQACSEQTTAGEGGEADAGGSASAGGLAGLSSDGGAVADNSSDFLDRLAKEHFQAYIKLIPEPATLAGVELAVRQSSLSAIRGQERRNVFMIMLSADSLAEVAGRAPHRRPPIEIEVLRRLLHGAPLGRGGERESEEHPVSIPGGDVVALHDGGRGQVQAMFPDLWKPTRKSSGTVMKHVAVDVKLRKLTLVMNEETVRQLKARVRGSNAYTLVHTVTLASTAELVPDMCPEKQRSLFSGYNVGDALGFINLEMYHQVWQADVQKKRDIYGARMVAVSEGDAIANVAATPPPSTGKGELEPVFYHQLPPDYYLEVIHSFNVVGVLGLSVGAGQVAKACLTRRIPYLGLCLTETHALELEKHLTSWVKDMMSTEGHPLCRRGCMNSRAKPQLQQTVVKEEGLNLGDQGKTKKDHKKGRERESSSDDGRSKKRKLVSKPKKKRNKKASSDESDSETF